jgi:predicted SPOUT superfamily RNA methylase MTH1
LNPKHRYTKRSIAISSSLVSEVPHLREKTAVIGQIGRAAAVFRVDDIYIYPDRPDEAQLIRLILSYLETPQYLRRRLFSKRPELRYVGVLPPLRTAHHPLENQAAKLSKGELREGVILSDDSEECHVDIGVEKPIIVTGRSPSIGDRATIIITEAQPELRGRFSSRKETDFYWGYDVHIEKKNLGNLALSKKFDLTVATSRLGVPYQMVEEHLRSRWAQASSVLIAFGSPRRGLGEILAGEGQSLNKSFGFTVNTIPKQGSETVRTEEAVYATLAILNLL